MVPGYLRQLISILPPSKYDLRHNLLSGILLASPKVRTFSCAALADFGTFFHLRCGLFPV